MRVLLIIQSVNIVQRADFLLRYGNLLDDVNNIIDIKYISYEQFLEQILLPNDFVIIYRIFDIRMKYIIDKCNKKNVICGIDIDNQYLINNQNLYNESLIQFINDNFKFCIVDCIFSNLHKCFGQIILPTFKLEYILLEKINNFNKLIPSEEKQREDEELHISFINFNNTINFSDKVFHESIYLYELYRKWRKFTLDLYIYKNNFTEDFYSKINFLPFNINIFIINENLFDLVNKYKYTYISIDDNLEQSFYYSILNCCQMANTKLIIHDYNNIIKLKNNFNTNYLSNELLKKKLFLVDSNLDIDNKKNFEERDSYIQKINQFLCSIKKNYFAESNERFVNVFSIYNHDYFHLDISNDTLLINFDSLAKVQKFDLSFSISDSMIYLNMSEKFINLIEKFNTELFVCINKSILKEKFNYFKLKFDFLESFIDFSSNDFSFLRSSLYLNQIYNELYDSLKMKILINQLIKCFFIKVKLYYL